MTRRRKTIIGLIVAIIAVCCACLMFAPRPEEEPGAENEPLATADFTAEPIPTESSPVPINSTSTATKTATPTKTAVPATNTARATRAASSTPRATNTPRVTNTAVATAAPATNTPLPATNTPLPPTLPPQPTAEPTQLPVPTQPLPPAPGNFAYLGNGRGCWAGWL